MCRAQCENKFCLKKKKKKVGLFELLKSRLAYFIYLSLFVSFFQSLLQLFSSLLRTSSVFLFFFCFSSPYLWATNLVRSILYHEIKGDCTMAANKVCTCVFGLFICICIGANMYMDQIRYVSWNYRDFILCLYI